MQERGQSLLYVEAACQEHEAQVSTQHVYTSVEHTLICSSPFCHIGNQRPVNVYILVILHGPRCLLKLFDALLLHMDQDNCHYSVPSAVKRLVQFKTVLALNSCAS